MKSLMKIIAAFVSILFVSACATSQQVHNKSSVVDYLYPNHKGESVKPTTAAVSLPARVGIAFVPEQTVRGKQGWLRYPEFSRSTISEAQKYELLRLVENRFTGRDFIEKIEIIPSAYLTDGGTFHSLEQLRSMFGIDLIALVSYDQVQFTDDSFLSIAYWTIVGAYIFSGEKNDTRTLMDTVVYDIDSKSMLLRAPGSSRVKGRSTPVNLSEELRDDSEQGFQLASKDMAANLDQSLQQFKQRVRAKTADVSISYRSGYSGGGGVDGLFLIGVLGVLAWRRFCNVGQGRRLSHTLLCKGVNGVNNRG